MTAGGDGRVAFENPPLAESLAYRSRVMRSRVPPEWDDGWPVAAGGTLVGGVPWALLLGADADGVSVDLSMRCPGLVIGYERLRLGETTMPQRISAGSGVGGRVTVAVCSIVAIDDASGATVAGAPVVEVFRSPTLGVRVLLGVEERIGDTPSVDPRAVALPGPCIYTTRPGEYDDDGLRRFTQHR